MYWDYLTRGFNDTEINRVYWDEFTYVTEDTNVSLSASDILVMFSLNPKKILGILQNCAVINAGEAGTFKVAADSYYVVIPSTTTNSGFVVFYDEDGNKLSVVEDQSISGSELNGTRILISLYPSAAVVQSEDPYSDLV